jgi:hypothetical protein
METGAPEEIRTPDPQIRILTVLMSTLTQRRIAFLQH